MSDDKPILGIFLMVAFCALIPFGDAIAKLLTGRVPLLEILLARFGMQAVLLSPFLLTRRDSIPRQPGIWLMMLWRTVLHIGGIGLMVTALAYLPLADAIAIAFVMPFIMLLLGWWFLGEEVGPRRLIACAVGFAGTLMVVQPAFADVGWPAFIPFAVAITFAFFILSTRQLTKRVESTVLQSVSGVIATLMLLLAWQLPILSAEARALVAPTGDLLWMLLLMGVIGTVAHYLMTLSLKFAPAATLAPMQYLEIPFATLIGWLIWQELPNGLAALGICVTIAAGFYIILREHSQEKLRQSGAT